MNISPFSPPPPQHLSIFCVSCDTPYSSLVNNSWLKHRIVNNLIKATHLSQSCMVRKCKCCMTGFCKCMELFSRGSLGLTHIVKTTVSHVIFVLNKFRVWLTAIKPTQVLLRSFILSYLFKFLFLWFIFSLLKLYLNLNIMHT